MGQGDSIFITTPNNKQILIDGGPNQQVLEQLAEVMPFLDRSIDLVINTHPENDHFIGLIEVIKRYKVQKLLITGINVNNPAFDQFLSIIQAKRISVTIASAAADFSFEDGVNFDVLYPFSKLLGAQIKKKNNSSIVLKLHYGTNSVLLGGDIEEEIENLLVEKNIDLKSEILKVNHHGSLTSSSSAFLDKVKARYAIIQSGLNNDFGHPRDEVLKRLILNNTQIFRNDYQGRIEFIMDKQGVLKVKTAR